ncbi:MAG: TFIIB-type zinc ribbon-containing protein [Ruminococcaceae bacterium]|nr:TFIIB-type zinc ribbon-containing protein [Oscillospiraceae bacterium]
MSTENAVAYQCPCCGAGLGFDPEKQKFACEFCLSEFDEAELASSGAAEAAQKQAADGESYCEQMNLFTCPNCGAEVIADDNTVADFCYYCHNPVVHGGRLSGQLQPHKIVPFRIDREEAQSIFLKWCKRKWFVPTEFKTRTHAAQIRGVYYPFWVTDADASGSADFNATKVRSWRAGDYKYTETKVYDVERAGEIHFEDIVTCALSETDKKMLEGVLPYPSAELVDFSMPYLSGFFAKKRDIERDALSEEVRGRMHTYTQELFRRTISSSYSTLSPSALNVHIKQSHWEYALLPIWVLTYTHKNGRVYTFALNGSTGKIYGELPISYPKLAILAGAVAVPATAILSMIGGVLF